MLQVSACQKVYDPGRHCAFTDIIQWRGQVWLTFREALNHSVHPSSQIVVMSSDDLGKSFEVCARITRPGLDVRDPHFFVVDDRLHITIPSWRLPRIPQRRVTLIAGSNDGTDFHVRDDIDLFENLTLWRPRVGPDGMTYATGRDANEVTGVGSLYLFRTADGLDWERISTIHSQEYPNETELCFLPEGLLIALARRELEPSRHPLLATSKPPYTEWTKMDCDQFLLGPLLERLEDGSMLVVGRSPRNISEPDDSDCVTRLFNLDLESGHLEPGPVLESGKDTSYAGYIHLREGSQSTREGGENALLSYYSGHEYENGSYRAGEEAQRCAIYMARVGSPVRETS